MSDMLYRCPAVLPTCLPHTRITVTTPWWQHPWEPRCTTTRRQARAASRCQVSCWTTASTSLNRFRFRCRCPSSPLSKSPALVCSQPFRHVAWPEVMPASACSLVCFCCTPVAFRIPKHVPCLMLSTNFYTVVLRQHKQCCIVEHVKTYCHRILFCKYLVTSFCIIFWFLGYRRCHPGSLIITAYRRWLVYSPMIIPTVFAILQFDPAGQVKV